MKAGIWKKDWFLGLVVTLLLLAAGGTFLIQSFERTAYDWGVRASSRAPSDKVVIIAIDDASIRNIGRWPWSREVHAKMTETLANAKAKVIGNLVFFSEPQVDAGSVTSASCSRSARNSSRAPRGCACAFGATGDGAVR
jgi:serine/threonine-protein kinase